MQQRVAPTLATAALAISIGLVWYAVAPEIAAIRKAEALVESADRAWELAFADESISELRSVLNVYERLLRLGPMSQGVGLRSFSHWIVRPLRFRCLHRVAITRGLLREDPPPIILQAHATLLEEGFCAESMLDSGGASDEQPALREYEACVAPLARGLILFAAGPIEAEAAFKEVMQLSGPGGVAALSWTSRLQLPDRHSAGLLAHPWWTDLPAVASLEAAFPYLLEEFEAAQMLLAYAARDVFTRRRENMWVAVPKTGWGRRVVNCTTATATCKLIQQAQKLEETKVGQRPSSKDTCLSPSGAVVACGGQQSKTSSRKAGRPARAGHYYVLRADTRLHVRVGATNERLTCHLTLRGCEGAWLSVGDTAKEWRPGRAFCFDDSFIHSAVHSGTEDCYTLQVQVAHPDLQHLPAQP